MLREFDRWLKWGGPGWCQKAVELHGTDGTDGTHGTDGTDDVGLKLVGVLFVEC